MTTNLDLQWSAPRELQTKFGPRILRTAPATPAFWDAWRARKDELKAEGYSCKKENNGAWTVTHWGKVDAAVTQERAATVEASRATDYAGDLPCPDGLSYLPYQRAGIAFAMDRPATLIADEMGLGKTIQAIGVINATPSAQRILVICPASLRLNWRNELRKWLTTAREIHIVTDYFRHDVHFNGVVIINYDRLHQHADELRLVDWDILICDEAHFAKSRKARRTRMVFGFEPTVTEKRKGAEEIKPLRAKRRLLLTGTPVANRPAELFPLIHYLDPVTWRSFFTYGKRYCAGHNNGWGWDFTGSSNLEELQQRLRSTLMIRRLKAEVLTDLPAKRRQVIELPVNGAAGAVAAELEAYEARAERIAALEAAVELAKASDDPEEHRRAVEALKAGVSAAFGEMSKLRHDTAVAKVPAIIEHVEQAIEDSGKVVLFAHHKDVIRAITEAFGDQCVVIVGDTPMAQREAAKERFQNDPSCKLIVGSIGAMGVGLTLTASSHVIMAELDWVPGNVSQAEDRCHRIGQRDSVLVQHLVLEGSLDATMAKRIIEKQEVIDRALDREDLPVYANAPVITRRAAVTQDDNRKKLDGLADRLTEEQRRTAHAAVRMLSTFCDGAHQLDGMGFSKIDVAMGHSLAAQESVSPRQAAICAKLARKYRGQLPDQINEVIANIQWKEAVS